MAVLTPKSGIKFLKPLAIYFERACWYCFHIFPPSKKPSCPNNIANTSQMKHISNDVLVERRQNFSVLRLRDAIKELFDIVSRVHNKDIPLVRLHDVSD